MPWSLIDQVFMQIMGETWSGKQHQELKAVTNGKLVTLNVLSQHLSLLETQHFRGKQTNVAS